MCESVPGAGGRTSAGNPGGDLGLRGETALPCSKNPCCIEEVGDEMEVPFCVLLVHVPKSGEERRDGEAGVKGLGGQCAPAEVDVQGLGFRV